MDASSLSRIEKSVDPVTGINRVRIISGQYYVSKAPEVVSTVLGSCVSAAIWDPDQHIGGINHFMHPGHAPANGPRSRTPGVAYYGHDAMTDLIRTMVSYKADRSRLIIKLFGGASLRSDKDDAIGAQNAEFAKDFLRRNGFALAASDLGGPFPRKVMFDIGTGKVMVKRLRSIQKQQIADQEQSLFDSTRR